MSAEACGLMSDVMLAEGTLWTHGTHPSATHRRMAPPSSRGPSIEVHSSQRIRSTACGEHVERGILAAVPGREGWHSYSNFMFHFLMPQWDALEQIGWDAAAARLPDARLFLTSSQGADAPLSKAPNFVAAMLPVLTHARVHSLDTLGVRLAARHRRGSGLAELLRKHLHPWRSSQRDAWRSGPICFRQLLVGCECAIANTSHGAMEHRLSFAQASRMLRFRQRLLTTLVPRSRVDNAASNAARGCRTGHDSRRACVLLFVQRTRNRRWLNANKMLSAAQSMSGVHSASIVSWEDLPVRTQVRTAIYADIMLGLDAPSLANAFWMRNGSAVVAFVPYGYKPGAVSLQAGPQTGRESASHHQQQRSGPTAAEPASHEHEQLQWLQLQAARTRPTPFGARLGSTFAALGLQLVTIELPQTASLLPVSAHGHSIEAAHTHP